jgi:predicted porin
MKKSLIALAVAGAFAAPAFAATSNVDVYGIIDASVNYVDLNDDESFWSVGSNGMEASRLGFKGSEDLGGGLKAIWQIESGFDVEGTGATIGKRNTFVGLSGGFGTVLIGNHDTPEKLSTGKLDFFADSVGDYNVGATIIDTRENNVIAYISPTFSGFHFAGAIVAGEYEGGSENDSIADHWSVAAMYENGPLYVGGGYTSVSEGYQLSANSFFGETLVGALTLGDSNMWRVGAGFKFGDFMVGGVYQNIDAELPNGTDLDIDDGYSIGGSWTMGPMVLKAQYQARDNLIEQWNLGLDYNLSKRTKAYAVYSDLQDEDSGDLDGTIISMGVRHSF